MLRRTQGSDRGQRAGALSENQVVDVQEEIAQYTTDTLPGSSGSPVLDDRWEVAAIHHAGGHLSKRDGTGARHFINAGILSAAVDRAVLI
ncbi:trypsin-like serine peptidase [Sorangium sp. So ce426]|uniref:trypsin-like serine peptidase n=1 Tax=unclassified Sorangium TaxID=2621164 RepID=UPI003F5B2286